MKIEVRFYAYLKEITGKHSETIILKEGAKINDVLKLIIDKYGERMRRYVLNDAGQLRSNITIAINGQKLDRGSAENYTLKDGDILVIIPPIAGGAVIESSSKLSKSLQVHCSVRSIDVNY